MTANTHYQNVIQDHWSEQATVHKTFLHRHLALPHMMNMGPTNNCHVTFYKFTQNNDRMTQMFISLNISQTMLLNFEIIWVALWETGPNAGA